MQSLVVSFILAENSISFSSSSYVGYSIGYAVGICHYAVICCY